jgi:hypothetical protein
MSRWILLLAPMLATGCRCGREQPSPSARDASRETACPCSKETLLAPSTEFGKLAAQEQFKEAHDALLAAYDDHYAADLEKDPPCPCAPASDQGWVVVRLAETAKKAGDDDLCIKALGLVHAGSDVDLELGFGKSVAAAIRMLIKVCGPGCSPTSSDLCETLAYNEAADGLSKIEFRYKTCPIPDYEAGVAIPAADSGKERCLFIQAGYTGNWRKALEKKRQVKCPGLALVERRGDGKPRERPLKLPRLKRSGQKERVPSFLEDRSFCCNADTLGIAAREGKVLIQVASEDPARECSGGAATMLLESIFSWDGQRLRGLEENSSPTK